MVQSLTTEKDKYDDTRVQELSSRIFWWFLDHLGDTIVESPTVQKLRRDLAVQVITPAIKFQCLLRQSRTSISVDTPITIEQAIRKHDSIEDGFMSALEIVVEPELKKVEYDTTDGKEPRETVLTPAFKHVIIEARQVQEANRDDHDQLQGEAETLTVIPSSSLPRYPSQMAPVYRRVTEPHGSNRSKGKGNTWLFLK